MCVLNLFLGRGCRCGRGLKLNLIQGTSARYGSVNFFSCDRLFNVNCSGLRMARIASGLCLGIVFTLNRAAVSTV